MSRADAAAGLANQERLKELRKCQRSSWYLATRYLGYGWSDRAKKGLTQRIHMPIMDWHDRNDDENFVGTWMARTRHKTTIAITKIIQSILKDPCKTHLYFHNVDDVAAATLSEVINHCQQNDKLRSLDPIGEDDDGKPYKIFPSKLKKRWFNQTSMTLNRHRFSRTPTVSAYGIGTEVTGLHADGDTHFDDIIALRTILNSELQKVKSWVQNTAMPLSDSKRFRSWGTPWSEHSIHQDWMESKDWMTLVVPGAIEETDEEFAARLYEKSRKYHFAPSYTFTNPVFGPVEYKPQAIKMLKLEEKHMKTDFAPQIMLDSEPESERPWNTSTCEHFTSIKPQEHMPGIGGKGAVFVLSDPAPLHVGGFKGLTEKQRGDGTKDFWSLQVWKLRPRGQILDAILLDGSRSQEWTQQQGCDEIARLMKKWSTSFYISEDPNTYFDNMRVSCLKLGVSMTRARDGGPLKFESYNKSDRKNVEFARFAGKAALGEVWISTETVSDDFLYGDGEHTGLLTQCRKYRRVAPNKNSLRWDDDADCAARVCDAALLEWSPQPEVQNDPFAWIDDDDDYVPSRSRYCVS